MKTSRVAFVAAVLLAGGFISGHASVRSYEKLTLDEKIALQESERRVATDDQQLLALDRELKRHKISTYDHQWQAQAMVSYINAEASFQNDILRTRPFSLDVELPEGATKVLRTIGKYSVGISLAMLEGILKGGGSFSP